MKTSFLLISFFAISLLMCIQNVASQTLSTAITLIVDFGSSTPYVNSECGGILDSSDTTIYPPCKSFKDAGNRARQYLNSGLAIPNSNYLTISVINTAITANIGGESAQLGNLFGFCTVDILIATTTSRAIVDGALSTSHFVSLQEPNVPNTSYQCSSGKTLRIRNIEFKNWGNQTIVYTNLNQVFNILTKQSIYFTTVYTWFSNSIINVQPKGTNFEYGSVFFQCSGGYFNNIDSSLTLPPFNFNGVNVAIIGSRFLNSTLNSSPFIYSNIGFFNLKATIYIDGVIIHNGHPFVKTLNVGDNFYYAGVIISNCVFSKFLQHENNQINAPRESAINHISLFQLSNNIITSNNDDPTNSFFSFQNYQDAAYTLAISTVNSENVQVFGNKSFIYNQNGNTSLYGFEIPNTFPIGLITRNSSNNLLDSSVFSDIPFAGINSIFEFNSIPFYSTLNTTNFNYCESCRISIDGQVVYDNY
ncbi:hypothetical protein ACTFIZ_001331 [Dictyostelium cf. discoideum]